MEKYRRILSSLIRSIVKTPELVTVMETSTDPPAFRIEVPQREYEPVVCKLSSIKSLAAACSDLPDGERVIVYLKPF